VSLRLLYLMFVRIGGWVLAGRRLRPPASEITLSAGDGVQPAGPGTAGCTPNLGPQH